MAKKRKEAPKTEIQLTDTIKIMRTDTLNWTVFELRESENDDGTTARTWTPRTNYFAHAEHAISWVSHMLISDKHEQMALDDAVKAIEKSNRKLARAVAESLEKSGVEA